jgi:cytochrome c oxidase subunit I+III
VAALAVELGGHWNSGLRPDVNGYAALVYLASVLQLEIVAAVVILGFYTIARVLAGRLNAARRVTFDVLTLLSHYAVGQGLLGLLLVHGFPGAVT